VDTPGCLPAVATEIEGLSLASACRIERPPKTALLLGVAGISQLSAHRESYFFVFEPDYFAFFKSWNVGCTISGHVVVKRLHSLLFKAVKDSAFPLT
jgi:hypothetical protein